jgi:hypothetical protein
MDKQEVGEDFGVSMYRGVSFGQGEDLTSKKAVLLSADNKTAFSITNFE